MLTVSLALLQGSNPILAFDQGPVAEIQFMGAYIVPQWLSPDDCRLYMAITGDDSRFDIWVAERPKIE